MASDPQGPEGEQLPLVAVSTPRPRRRARVGDDPPAAEQPVALVQVDTGLAHLDRPFEYRVPESLSAAAQPGVRVKVRFAGRDLDGFILERRDVAGHAGALMPLRSVVSPEQVLRPEVLRVAGRVARARGGTLGDVLRLAVPPRHATAERALAQGPGEPVTVPTIEPTAWTSYAAGSAFLRRLAAGEAPAAAVLALPAAPSDLDWTRLIAEAVATTVAAGRGAVVVLPDARDIDRVTGVLDELLDSKASVRLTADQGPQARYTAFLKVLRGQVPVVVGTRAAAWAPVHDLGLVVWWDDGDDLHEEPRFPHVAVREVLLARAEDAGAGALTLGFSRSVPVEDLVRTGRLAGLEPERGLLRSHAPRVRVAGEGSDEARDPAVAAAHLPTVAWRTAKEALARGPVLVQVPRRGYLPALACQECRRPARCVACAGPLALSGPTGPPACRWCDRVEASFACPHCEGRRLRSSIIGARRTAEELGRAFPGVPVDRSGADTVLARVASAPRLVVATPGAEPVAEGGFAAVLLLDAWALIDRPGLLAGEEALRRWMGAAALVAPRAPVVLCGAPSHATIPAIEALMRWDPVWFADRELEERLQLGLPPSQSFASIVGRRRAVASALADLRLPEQAKVLGPLPTGVEEEVRALVTVPRAQEGLVAAELAAARALASARKEADGIRIRVGLLDPLA